MDHHDMERLTVTLSDELGGYVHECVADSDWPSGEDYVRALVEADRRRNAELRRLLQEGEDSGISKRTPREVVEAAFKHAG